MAYSWPGNLQREPFQYLLYILQYQYTIRNFASLHAGRQGRSTCKFIGNQKYHALCATGRHCGGHAALDGLDGLDFKAQMHVHWSCFGLYPTH